MKTVSFAILMSLVLAAAGRANPPFTVSPETTAITGPLRPDGSVDYVAALNARYGQGVTPENNVPLISSARRARRNFRGAGSQKRSF